MRSHTRAASIRLWGKVLPSSLYILRRVHEIIQRGNIVLFPNESAEKVPVQESQGEKKPRNVKIERLVQERTQLLSTLSQARQSADCKVEFTVRHRIDPVFPLVR